MMLNFPSLLLQLILFLPRIRPITGFINCTECGTGNPVTCPPDVLRPHIDLQVKVRRREFALVVHCRTPVVDYSFLEECSFSTVQSLQINHCPFANGSISASYPGLETENILNLHLRGNVRSFTSPTFEFFEGFSNLNFLNLESLRIKNIPGDFFKFLTKLEKLYVFNTNLDPFPTDIFQPLTSLRKLYLVNSGIHGLPEGILDSLVNVDAVSIWTSNITTIPHNLFHKLGNLKNLTFSKNNLISISEDVLTYNKELISLDFSHNKLAKLPELLFRNNSNLKRLAFDDNVIESLPESLFSYNKDIYEIDFKSNKLGQLPQFIFKSLVNLKVINFSFNKITFLPKDVFSFNEKIESIDFSGNKLSSLISKPFQFLKNLKTLNLDGNLLNAIPDHSFQSSVYLQSLSLKNNNISRLSYLVFPRQVSSTFKKIDLSYNRLNTDSLMNEGIFAFNTLMKLEDINLSYNNFTSFPSKANFFNLLDLKVLNLQGNQIKNISMNQFFDIPDGTIINMRHNKIQRIKFDSFYKSKYLFMQLEGNNFNCDCDVYHIVSLLKNSGPELQRFEYEVINRVPTKGDLVNGLLHIIDGSKLTCKRPQQLAGKLMKNVSPSSLYCDVVDKDCDPVCSCSYWPASNSIVVNCSENGLTDQPLIPFNNNHNYVLDLSGNRVHQLSFSPDDPVKSLILSGNDISSDILTNITDFPLQLDLLDLSSNNLTHLSDIFLSKLESRPVKLKLNDNPWICDCSIKDFHNFLQNNFERFEEMRRIVCFEDDPSRPLIDLTEADICPVLLRPAALASIGALTALLFILAVLGTSLYFRYKSGIKIWLYSRKICLWFVTEREADADKTFDAFVSYSHKDEEFVNNILVPGLENGDPKYRVCLHYRDWVAGEFIQHQILRSVADSRRTLVVLSSNFIESVWGQMEFRAAHQQALQDRTNRVIVIVYGEMPAAESMDEDLRHYVSLHTYLKWGDPRFWRALRYAMPHPQQPPLSRSLSVSRKRKILEKMELSDDLGRPVRNPNSDSGLNGAPISHK